MTIPNQHLAQPLLSEQGPATTLRPLRPLLPFGVQKVIALNLEAADLYSDVEFTNWLANCKDVYPLGTDGPVVVMVDPSCQGEGSASDMPAQIWAQIVQACSDSIGPDADWFHIMVNIANVERTDDLQRTGHVDRQRA